MKYRISSSRNAIKAKFKRVCKEKSFPWASGPKRTRITGWERRLVVAMGRSIASSIGRMSQRVFNRCMCKCEAIGQGVYDSKGYLKPWQKNSWSRK